LNHGCEDSFLDTRQRGISGSKGLTRSLFSGPDDANHSIQGY